MEEKHMTTADARRQLNAVIEITEKYAAKHDDFGFKIEDNHIKVLNDTFEHIGMSKLDYGATANDMVLRCKEALKELDLQEELDRTEQVLDAVKFQREEIEKEHGKKLSVEVGDVKSLVEAISHSHKLKFSSDMAQLNQLIGESNMKSLVKAVAEELAKQNFVDPSVPAPPKGLSRKESCSVIDIGGDEEDQPWTKLYEPEVKGKIAVNKEDDDLLMSMCSKFNMYGSTVDVPESEGGGYNYDEAKKCRKAMYEATIRRPIEGCPQPVTAGGSKNPRLATRDWSKVPTAPICTDTHLTPESLCPAFQAEVSGLLMVEME